MGDSDSSSESSADPPPTLTFKSRLVDILSNRPSTALYTDLLTKDILENKHLRSTYYDNPLIGDTRCVTSQASILTITFKVILQSIARTGGIDGALLTIIKVLVGGHTATSFDGYFALVRAFNLNLYELHQGRWNSVSKDKMSVLRPRRLYTLCRIDNEAPPLVTGHPMESERIEVEPILKRWYNDALTVEDSFHVADFVNNLCGAVAMSILEEEDAVTPLVCGGGVRGSKKRPIQIDVGFRAGSAAAALPPLHLLSIR